MSNDKKTEVKAAAPEVKADPLATLTPEQLKAVFEKVASEMIPSAVAAAVVASGSHIPAVIQTQPKVPEYSHRQVCTECGQLQSACRGDHVDMVVFPQKYEEYAEFFRGRCINGVWYLSNNADHKVRVPACAANEIKQAVEQFEQNEHDMRNGRKAGKMFADANGRTQNNWR